MRRKPSASSRRMRGPDYPWLIAPSLASCALYRPGAPRPETRLHRAERGGRPADQLPEDALADPPEHRLDVASPGGEHLEQDARPRQPGDARSAAVDRAAQGVDQAIR